ncbi:piggyBac transposable element-derived protein 4-like [Micropterus salmoides]|uniref:piggyBac transposable element-derived protein 4-like n=1 Tax=Micropterus salmoides TaxID=27706 RepID=UPI0018EB3F53|nr:piggyBac transposable element-derived protein 4-like [Micropterus salmoides]
MASSIRGQDISEGEWDDDEYVSDRDYDYEDEEEYELYEDAQQVTSTQRSPIPSAPSGPTPYAVSLVRDIASAFGLFFTHTVEKLILEMTNLEAERTGYEQRNAWWKAGMGETELRAYVGLLILAGVYRSRGEAAASLWDAESGCSIFRATMPLKVFYAYSKLLRFDDRETRAQRRASDKLVRELWDRWAERLPYLYNPGPDVTVDEQLVPLRGRRCPFRQYMPNKPAKYGIKSWVACDAKSSYAWKMQVYVGKKELPTGDSHAPALPRSEKNQGARVVLELTEGLSGPRNVTCDNFFTSYELGQRLLERGLTMLGTVRKNKPELPPALVATKGRPVFSSQFAFTGATAKSTTLVSYVPKKNKNMLIMTTLPWRSHSQTRDCSASASYSGLSERSDRKPNLVLKYNSTKGGVDNLDKVIATYSCRRMTSRWPVVIFHNILDVSAYNAYVIWRETNPAWLSGNRNKRRLFLEQLGKALVTPLIEKRRGMPRAEDSAALVRTLRIGGSGDSDPGSPSSQPQPTRRGSCDHPTQDILGSLAHPKPNASKRKRCQICPPKKDSKTYTTCQGCSKYVCKSCVLPYCPACV